MCSEAGASPAWGTPCCSPSAPRSFSMLLRFLVIFPQPRVRKRPRGSCCSRACWQQEPCWLPGGSLGTEVGQGGGQWVPTMLLCKQLQPPGSPKIPSGRSPSTWMGGRGKPSSALGAQEGRFTFRRAKLQILPPSLQRLLLALGNLLVSGIKFQH